MEITFVLPSLTIAGGVRTIFELSNKLAVRGHHIRIVYCTISPWEEIKLGLTLTEGIRRLYRNSKSLLETNSGGWFTPLLAETIRIPRLRARYIPDSEVLIATAWPTAEEVIKANVWAEKKFYFIQGYEICHGPVERVKATYKLPLKRIVISSFLKRVLAEEIGVDSRGPVFMGVNFSEFNRSGRSQNTLNRIGMLYHRHPMKGVTDGLRAFEIAKRRHPNIKLVLFGVDRPLSNLPEQVEFHRHVPQDLLKYIYSSCSIWLIPSLLEGFCLIPMEAMACGCAVVSTRIGGIDDYAIPGETALVSEPGDVKGLANNLCMVLDDKKFLLEIAEKGHQYIQQFTWDKAVTNFQNSLSIDS